MAGSTSQRGQTGRGYSRLLPPALVVGALVLLLVLAEPKPKGVLGRLDYQQFLLVVVGIFALLATAIVAVSARERRRRVVFRFLAVPLGTLVVVLPWELACYLPEPRHPMDNPWYLHTGGGVAHSQELPFARPPHLLWRGVSRGDLAILYGDRDPSEREVEFRTDHQGFRNSQDLDRADIVFLGDSFTEA